MSSLEGLAIAGFRSYSTQALQIIQFKKPLTLVWGKNGSGKTTIIEALKYTITGSLPPSCERGKSFIMEPRIMGKSEVVGEIRLKFRAFNDRQVMAVRRALLTITQKGSKFESIEQILKTRDDNGVMIEINHNCAQIEKQIPILLGSSKSILENIVFCNQDGSLWPFEDSATLKNIFDELFETKKYTQVIEALWQQRKEYKKKIGEIKKALPYLQRLYEEDKRRKLNSLFQVEDINKQTGDLRKTKNQLSCIESEARLRSDEAMNQRKFELGRERKSFEDKIASNKLLIAEGLGKIRSFQSRCQKVEELELRMEVQQSRQQMENLKNELSTAISRRDQIKNKLSCFEAANIYSQKQMQLNSEVMNAKEFLPESQGERLSDQQICKRLLSKRNLLQSKKNQLIKCKGEYEKCVIPEVVIEVCMTEQKYQLQKSSLSNLMKSLSDLRQKILRLYFTMYKKVNQKELYYCKEENLASRLVELQLRLKIKREELQRFKKMPKENTAFDTREKIMKLKCIGIDFYESYIDYCTQKKKCSLCSKPVSDEELRVICGKSQKVKEKTLKQIRDLEAEIPLHEESQSGGVNPQVMISRLIGQISMGQKSEKILIQKVQEYQKVVQMKEQMKINDRLKEGIRVARLLDDVQRLSSQEIQKIADASLDIYAQIVKKFRDVDGEIDRKKAGISQFEEQVRKNSQNQARTEELRRKKNILRDNILSLQEDTKNFDIITRIASKLQVLIKQQKENLDKSWPQTSNTKETIQQLTQELDSLEKIIARLEIQLGCYQCGIQVNELEEENKKIGASVNAIDREIVEIEKEIKKIGSRNIEYTNLKVEYQRRQREADLKTEMAFQEYYRPVEKEFLLQKDRLVQMESTCRDIELYCSTIENAISKTHKSKMDEINKIIEDIWKQIYHEEDISSIEILTSIDEDKSKKKRNYNYSIMMQKRGANTAKIEMKGRCSMGQKVLASIVIRLALAEVFSNNARILALDEPTTFLDRQHINKLAQELCRLIELNEGEGSFQLIIISHDLDFIRLLDKYTSHYYEVSRNRQQFSIITCREFRDIFENKK